MREKEERLEMACPFCRQPTPKLNIEDDRMMMKRVEANDPVALRQVGKRRSDQGDYKSAVEYWRKAAALGDVIAHYQLSVMYHNSWGVEKDEKRELYHLEQAAIGGHPGARHNLGLFEAKNNGNAERAVKHWFIAAKLGDDDSMEKVKKGYQGGIFSEEDFTSTLRAHRATKDATKSPQREAAEKAAFTYLG